MAGRRRSGARPPADSQHFLRDPRLAAQLVREAGVGPRDLVARHRRGQRPPDGGAVADRPPRARGRAGPSLGGAARRALAERPRARGRRARDHASPRGLQRRREPAVRQDDCDPPQAVRRSGDPPRPRRPRRRVGRRDTARAAVAEPGEEHRLGLDVRDRRHAPAAARRVRPRATRRCRRRLVQAPPLAVRAARGARAIPSLRRRRASDAVCTPWRRRGRSPNWQDEAQPRATSMRISGRSCSN